MAKKGSKRKEWWRYLAGGGFCLAVCGTIAFVYSCGYFESKTAYEYKKCMFQKRLLLSSKEDAARQCLGGVIKKASNSSGVPAELVWAVVSAESNFNYRAISPRGALGLMQLMPETAAELGVRDPFDPEENITAGAKYLRQLLKQHNDMGHALAAYNAGPATVARHKGIPPFEETRKYVAKVMASYSKEKNRKAS